MKTLDGVIEALEEMIDLTDADSESEGYYLAMDSLEYLKEYSELLYNVEPNEPLSIYELKAYIGKPVWVEWISGTWKGLHKWVLIERVSDLKTGFMAVDVAGISYKGSLHSISMGKTWNAYRKEKK